MEPLIQQTCSGRDCFHSTSHFKKITPQFFLERFLKYTFLEAEMLPYVYKLIEKSKLCFCSLSYPRVFSLAASTFMKINCDFFYDNEHLSKVSGISLCEFNNLEIEFLKALNYIGVEN